MAAPKKVDYDAIEPDWRAGIKSPEQIATEYHAATGVKVSRAAIAKHFKKLGIGRDLSAKVQAKAASMVAEAMVTGKVSKVTTLKDAEIINESALTVAAVQIAHRKDINRNRNLALSLLEELEAETGSIDLFKQLGEIMAEQDGPGVEKLNEIYKKVIGLPQRIDSVKKLSETLKNLIMMEREAYGIKSAEGIEGNEVKRKTLADFYASP